ncbi:I78 family peptidase inhibitor [Falsirhodobacter deserti]|uniref:I78 family peptidase inhibitor n=1 Tax=Falsirhodobacter deserti TaxID=1365611 RepID=UPI0013E2A2CD|nr:I78 family peptidase inhibitor [Falsirhodobacter deserti]
MKYIAFIVAGLTLAACETTTRTTVVAPATCEAGPYQTWIGKDSASLSGMQTPYTLRIIRPNQPVTLDFNPSRLNVETDAKGVITAVRCG